MSLSVSHLCKDFPTRGGPLSVLRDISFELAPSESLAVMGPSGSGKSTLLHLLGTLDVPTSGTIKLEGKDPFSLPEFELADFRNRNVGFVFQEHYLLSQCSVLENVLIPTLATSASDSQVEKRAHDLLERVGLSQRLDHRPAELSGGERQRVAIARALIQRPKLLLADEPTGNLDRTTARSIGVLLLEMHRQENSILVIVTHSAELAAFLPLPSRREMNDGQLIAI